MKKYLLHGIGISLLALLSACGNAGNDATAESPATVEPARAFASCAGCHAYAPGAANRAGPNLYGVIGRTAGQSPGFAYSAALRKSGIVWDEQTLDEFLQAPTLRVPGTRMSTRVSDEATRYAIIQYLSAPKP